MSSSTPSPPGPARSLADLLRSLEAGGTGLVAVTLLDGRVAEMWIDHGHLSHATCADVDPLGIRLGVGRSQVVHRPAATGGSPVEHVRSGVDPDEVRVAFDDLTGDIVAELTATGIARVQAVQLEHPYRRPERAMTADGDPDDRPRNGPGAPSVPPEPAPASEGPTTREVDATSAALKDLIEGVREL